ncbi:MAG: HU family DNA-binding protein [Synergistales bacterium]|nr:HU family DNA-binding protein [Bacteroidales bacterium]MDY6394530.1 HU family DNA-binding protein [Bacteroidales bacterium]MDY6402495.1 HU family DNA-binding protein [Bacteroidales bacterium]MDY6424403.1 HU family DNA-binding protein [Bacteroidales bacterium]MDY6435740.1 HU family DNA-binding protein [Synergistales bacterium]
MIHYRKMVRKVNYNGDIKQKYNAKILYSGELKLKDLAKEISSATSLNSADVYSAVKALQQVFVSKLTQGYILDLEELGRFKASFSANACDSLEEVNATSIHDWTVLYKPGKEIKEALKDVKIQQDRRFDEYGNQVKNSHKKKTR